MPPDRLAEIEALCAAATAGPWRKGIDDPNDGPTPCVFAGEAKNGPYIADCTWDGNGEQQNADAAFIAASRTAVPELLAEVTRLRAELAAERERARALAAIRRG